MDVRCWGAGKGMRGRGAERLTAVGKQDSAYVYKDWRHLPRATRVASLSGRVVPLILDNEKKTPRASFPMRVRVHLALSFNRHLLAPILLHRAITIYDSSG